MKRGREARKREKTREKIKNYVRKKEASDRETRKIVKGNCEIQTKENDVKSEEERKRKKETV